MSRIVNTTSGPREIGDANDVYHRVNRSDIFEPPQMVYLDEEDDIVHVLSGGDWAAELEGGQLLDLVVWVVLESGTTYGVAIGDDGKVDLFRRADEEIGFKRYIKHKEDS